MKLKTATQIVDNLLKNAKPPTPNELTNVTVNYLDFEALKEVLEAAQKYLDLEF